MYERAIELERAQRYGDALQAFVACRAQNEIAALLLEKGNELLEQGYTDSVASALHAIVAQNEAVPARLASLMGTIEAVRGRIDVSEAWFREAAGSAASRSEAAEIAYWHACALARRSNGSECEKLLLPLLRDNQHIPTHLRASIEAMLAVSHVLMGNFVEAGKFVDASIQLLDDHAPPMVRAQVYQRAAWVHLFRGNVNVARSLAPEAARLAMDNGLHEIAATSYSVLYNIAVDIDDDPFEGAQFLKVIADCGKRTRNARFELYAILGLYDLAAESGDFAEAARLQSELQRHEIAYGDAVASQMLLPAEALELAAAGDFKAAYEILAPSASRQADMDDDRLALRHAEIATYAAAAGMPAEAKAAEASARAALGRLSGKSLRTQRAQIYLAIVAMLNGDEVAMQSSLHSLKTEISPRARIRALLDCITLLWQYWRGAENHDELFRSLDRLWYHKLGGLASVIEALPHPELLADLK